MHACILSYIAFKIELETFKKEERAFSHDPLKTIGAIDLLFSNPAIIFPTFFSNQLLTFLAPSSSSLQIPISIPLSSITISKRGGATTQANSSAKK